MRHFLALLAFAAVIEASPFPQGVTGAISPSAPAPPGCLPTYAAGSFGIAVMNLTAAQKKRQVSTTIPDGHPRVPMYTMGMISQFQDGQIQGGMHTVTMMPVSQTSDSQIKATVTFMAVSTIADGQPQAPILPKKTAVAVSTIPEDQAQPSKGTSITTSTKLDHQARATTSEATTSEATSTTSSPAPTIVACKTNSTLELTLADSILTDSEGRTGYIAANYQFQFDKPPQAGAIYTSGFSVCANGSLALGGSNIFYQCLSGSFYNLYDRLWAPQCSPITLKTLELITC